MTFDGNTFAFDQRQRAVRELERLRREGVLVAKEILDLITPENLEELWPYVAQILNRLLKAQQDAGRDTMMGYMAAVGVGVGLGVASAPLAVPDASLLRNDRLPSGMPWARLTGSGILATAHRVENGMSTFQAVQALKGQMIAAVADQVHDEARKVATDLLQADQAGVDWARLDADYEAKKSAAYQRFTERQGLFSNEEIRRQRRSMSSKQKYTAGWFDNANDPFRPPNVTRYIRVPSAGACPFCLLLATKGAVYYEDSWSASKHFRKSGEAKAHAHCRCAVMPEPSPGAWKNTVIGDPRDYAAAVWTHAKSKRTYDLATFVNAKTLLTLSEVEQLRYILAA